MKSICRSKLVWIVVVLVVAILVVRAMLPIWVRDYVNRKLSEMEDYRGHVAEVAFTSGAAPIRSTKSKSRKPVAGSRSHFSPRR